MIKLSKRLQAIADFVPQGAVVGDVGTDHGYLPCYLVQSSRCPNAIAGDINKMPLEGAKKTIDDYLLNQKVETRLGNGLQIFQPHDVDVVTISGMGGSLMVEMLENSVAVVTHLQRLILQPNVASQAVRVWAEKNRWHIVDEQLIYEDGHFYEVIALEQGKAAQPYTAVELQFGPILLQKKHELLADYIVAQWQDAQFILGKLGQSNSQESQRKRKQIESQWEMIGGVMQCQLGVKLS